MSLYPTMPLPSNALYVSYEGTYAELYFIVNLQISSILLPPWILYLGNALWHRKLLLRLVTSFQYRDQPVVRPFYYSSSFPQLSSRRPPVLFFRGCCATIPSPLSRSGAPGSGAKRHFITGFFFSPLQSRRWRRVAGAAGKRRRTACCLFFSSANMPTSAFMFY